MKLVKDELKKIPFLVNGVNAVREHKKKVLYRNVFNNLKLEEKPKRKVLFYPDLPTSWNAIRSVMNVLNFDLTNDPQEDCLFVVKWHDTTYKINDLIIKNISLTVPVFNMQSSDISKTTVDKLSGDIFGYSTIIDPLKFSGPCVQKSNLNSFHDGKITVCPIQGVQEGSIYQILINNKVENKYVEDIRVPFFKDHIPFVYIKYKLPLNQFNSKTERVFIKSASEVFSKDEIKKIILLTQSMGLDFAELDILRNRDDNRIYVIDVNDTPGGFPKNCNGTDALNIDQKKVALFKMSQAFYNSFLSNIY